MSIVIIPGFGANALAPTRENLAALKGMHALPVAAFASARDYFEQGGYNSPPPQDGEAKYWNVPGANRQLGFIFCRRNLDGNGYISRKPVRDAQQMPIHTRLFSLKAWNFFDSRPNVMVPDLEIKWMSAEEAKRLSFPAIEVTDPIDYPIASVESVQDFDERRVAFNQDAILIMENGKPGIMSIEAAIQKFPVQWGPIQNPSPVVAPAGGVPVEDVMKFAMRLISNSGVRSKVLGILQGPQSAAAKVGIAMKVE